MHSLGFMYTKGKKEGVNFQGLKKLIVGVKKPRKCKGSWGKFVSLQIS